LLEPFLEDLAHKRVERHLPIRVARPLPDDYEPLPGRDANVVEIERDELGETHTGVQQHHQIVRSRADDGSAIRNSRRTCSSVKARGAFAGRSSRRTTGRPRPS
jgi:hypothetical protein